MNDSLAIVCAACIAVLIPSALVGGASQSASGFFAIVFSGMYVVLLGLPSFLILRRFKVLRWWSVCLAGFVCGTIPMAIISWPYSASAGTSYTAWDGSKMVEYLVNDVPTVAGWWSYAYGAAGVGALGAVAALGSWVTYTRLTAPA
jgi:hypothetical protein